MELHTFFREYKYLTILLLMLFFSIYNFRISRYKLSEMIIVNQLNTSIMIHIVLACILCFAIRFSSQSIISTVGTVVSIAIIFLESLSINKRYFIVKNSSINEVFSFKKIKFGAISSIEISDNCITIHTKNSEYIEFTRQKTQHPTWSILKQKIQRIQNL